MDNLPYEILQHIILYCTPNDIDNLIIVSKLLCTVCKDSYTWYKLIEQNFSLLPNYNPDKDYREIYYNIWYSDFTTFDFSQECEDTFYCTAYTYIKNLHICKSFNESLFKLSLHESPLKFKMFLTLAKQILTTDQYKALLYYRDECESTILHATDDAEVAQIILNEIDDKNAFLLLQDNFGDTPLFYSSKELASILLNNVEDPESYCLMQNIKGETALFKNSGNEGILLSHVTNTNAYCRHVSHNRQTAVMNIKNTVSFRTVLDNVYDIDNYCSMVDNNGDTILHLLTAERCHSYQQEFLVRILFEKIKDIDKFCYIQNFKGQTALHLGKFLLMRHFFKNYVKSDKISETIIRIDQISDIEFYQEYIVQPIVYSILKYVKDVNNLLNVIDLNGNTILQTPVGSKFELQ